MTRAYLCALRSTVELAILDRRGQRQPSSRVDAGVTNVSAAGSICAAAYPRASSHRRSFAETDDSQIFESVLTGWAELCEELLDVVVVAAALPLACTHMTHQIAIRRQQAFLCRSINTR